MDVCNYFLVALATAAACSAARIPRAPHCDVICDEDFAEASVCGSDGNLYRGMCEFSNANCLLVSNGSQHLRVISRGPVCVDETTDCDTVARVSCVHYQGNTPDTVCGTDGKSYDNVCALVAQKCNRHHGLRVNYTGPCPLPLTNRSREVDCSKYVVDQAGFALEADFHLPLQVIPCPNVTNASLCAFDHRTYKSECDYCGHLVQIHQIKKDNLSVYIQYDGQCSHG